MTDPGMVYGGKHVTAHRRILWNRRPDRTDPGDIDEIVLTGWVHVEQMDDRCWWIGIITPDGGYWSGNFTANSRGRMTFTEQEHEGFEWDEDSP